MIFSISSVFITLCVSLLLIALFSFILTHEKSYRLFRSDLLFILALITCLRLFFPFEFQFTKTIVLPPIMNPLIDILNLEIFGQIKLLNILLIIWGIGIIVGLGIYIHNVLTVNKAENRILKNSKRIKMSELLNDFASPDYDVYISDSVPSPMVLGFKKCILIPDISFTKEELFNILKHEAQHLRQNDILLKQVISILVILYWWFPPIYFLRKNINFYIEVRADEKVTDQLDSSSTLDYAQTLLDVQKKIQNTKSVFSNSLSSYLIGESNSILSYRINYLLNKQFKKKTNKLLLGLLFILPILTNSIIFESYFSDTVITEGTLSEEELIDIGYLIQQNDGTYLFCIGNEKYPIQDPTDLIKSGIHVIKE